MSALNGRSSNGFTRLANGEQFAKFFECFMSEQSRDLAFLRSADSASPRPSDADLRQLVNRVVSHYEYYYRAKFASAQNDVNTMFSPSWTSSTENLFMWVGGWRPSAAFHLLYSKSGIQLEAKLEEIIRGRRSGDLGDLSPVQLESVDKLQRKTIKMEREISEEEAKAQEELTATRMVEIVGRTGEGELEGEMESKRKAVLSVLERADKLRIETIKGIVEVLEPIQAVHFLIAAAELHLTVHEFGRRKDAVTNGTNGGVMET
ncbi:hypothetical protein LUZ60_009699 [Juncus effusus]|nr:hypothetical protein LUZ60_009699 [Juncus effusus]